MSYWRRGGSQYGGIDLVIGAVRSVLAKGTVRIPAYRTVFARIKTRKETGCGGVKAAPTKTGRIPNALSFSLMVQAHQEQRSGQVSTLCIESLFSLI